MAPRIPHPHRVRLFTRSANYGRGVEIRVVEINHDGDVIAEAKPLEFVAVDPSDLGQATPEAAPALMLRYDAAQSLFDELWQQGYRPARGDVSPGHIKATEKHLEDMRAIVFAKIEVAKP